MVAPALKASPLTLAQLARQALASADGDTRRATDALAARLQKDDRLLKTVLAAVVADAVDLRVEKAMRERRRSILRTAGAADGRAAVITLGRGLTAALLDMPLANGVRLRDATREQVSEQAQRYEAMSADMGRKARWLGLIGQSLRDGQTVGEAVTETRAQELWREAA